VSFLDLGATLYFSKTNDKFVEANPIAKYIWGIGGDVSLISFKLIVTLLSCACVKFVLQNKKQSWRNFVSVFGFCACLFLIFWWIFWIFYAMT